MAKERPPLEEMTLRQLRRVASEYGVSRYSRMRKSQLLTSIQEIQHTKFSYSPSRTLEAQEAVEAAKFELGQEDRTGGSLSSVDEDLADLPAGYGESQIILMPRDPEWAYTYWDIPNDRKEKLRRQGGQQIALRIYDVTDINLEYQSPHNIQEYPCDELAREWYVPIPVSDRDYVIDIGYRCPDGRWLVLARSAEVRVPPIYPSDWIEDQFLTLEWDEDLRGKTFAQLVAPGKKAAVAAPETNVIYEMAESAEEMRTAGSMFGSMQHVAGSMQHVAGSMQHVAGSVQHVAGSVQHVAGSVQHVAGSVQHIAGSVQHVAGSMQHIAGSVQHVAGSVQHVAGSVQHVAGSVQHVAGSVQHVAGSVQHVAGSVQHIAGSIQHEQSLSSYVFPSGVGMWAGLTTSGAGLTMSGAGLTMSGAGLTMSGAGLTMSGAGLGSGFTMSGAGLTMSGAGLTMSGAGLTMSGAGLTMSGAGLTMSGAGLGSGFTMSGSGFTMSGAGLTMSGAGLTMSGAGLTMSGAGLTMSGAGLGSGFTMSGSGFTMSGAGLTMSGAGLTMSGAGLGAGLTMSGAGLTMSGAGLTMSGAGLTMSGAGLTMSGAGLTMSGAGFSASMPPAMPRKFWLVADAELIVYGATEPDATVYIGGQPIKLNPDGTFRYQMSFQNGLIDYPIFAVAADGEQNRSIHMKFTRETPDRRTNTKEEAVLEWLG
jgi:uncharacterized protein